MRVGKILPAMLTVLLLVKADNSRRDTAILQPAALRHYVEEFNAAKKLTEVDNKVSAAWLEQNVPLFECADKALEEAYYFRWWTFRKHLQKTPEGSIIADVRPPTNRASRVFYEGRWLRNRQYLADTARLWFRRSGENHQASAGMADALEARTRASDDQKLFNDLLSDLVENFRQVEKAHGDLNGLFWETGDHNSRVYSPVLNSYLYGDATAIANLAGSARSPELAKEFRAKAEKLRDIIDNDLWDGQIAAYETLRAPGRAFADDRQAQAYVPWCFNLPRPSREISWKHLMDSGSRERLWNDPSWPSAASQTLGGIANLLNNYKQNYVGKSDFLQLLRTYAVRYRKLAESSDANDSTFNDLIITGLAGLRPRLDHLVEINPLVPNGEIPYFALTAVPYHGVNLDILYDQTGNRYHRGAGLHVYADGQEIAASPGLERVTANLPQAVAGWRKYEQNPIIGGQYGTMFDVAVLKEGPKYRMWASWRPKQSLALLESEDGIHWSEPQIVLGPNSATDWEQDINRPGIVKRSDGYHLWYTGQWHASRADGRSWIGYATSPDGKVWKRMSARPVLSPDRPWEKVAVMCPHVIWDEQAKLFRMWYSGGEQIEPNAIGYATSPDGIHWTKYENPILAPLPDSLWEQERVTAPQVFRLGDWYYMLYIGFRDMSHAQIGIARSRDGVTNWQRSAGNPIIRPGQDAWDQDACYKPFAFFDGKQWLLWYNGRRGSFEQIGLATKNGEDLGFRD